VVTRVMELWGVGWVIGVHDSVAKAAIAAAGLARPGDGEYLATAG